MPLSSKLLNAIPARSGLGQNRIACRGSRASGRAAYYSDECLGNVDQVVENDGRQQAARDFAHPGQYESDETGP